MESKEEKKSDNENELFLNNDNSDLNSLTKDKLVQELNQLSNDFPRNKQRMVEIAKVLLARHYWYTRKEKSD